MATTTTNFGWDIPQSTDLVKDGATAIAALGQDIDTAFVDLKGGTTGQVLAKASGTDLDYTWTTPQVGDITAVTAGTGITGGGTSGDVTINVDPTYAGFTNMLYAKNAVINGGFDIWQRGTSFTASSATTGYTADRWLGYRSVAGGTISRQATGDTTNLPNIQYCARISRDSGNTSTATINYYNIFETVNSIPLAGKTVTLSFYARKGANYSPTTTNVLLTTGTGTDQNILSGFTGQTNALSSTLTATTTWARYTYTATLAATATQLSVGIILNPLGTAGAADYLEITGVQLEAGSTATPFSRNGSSIQGELAACQRYYVQFGGSAIYERLALGIWSPATNFAITVNLPVTLRVAATAITYSTLTTYDANTFYAISSITIDAASKNTLQLNAATATSTQYRPGQLLTNNSTSGYLGISAEL